MDQEQLADVVREIEDEQALNRISAVDVFKGMLNQPELVSLSSANATPNGSSYGYSSFNVNMPRPILETETLQLLAANIPLCTQNIPDTACAFWYYRLDDYANTVPNPECLFFVRLLPSYYKPEFITAGKYGFNVTFNTYNDVATQLALSCTNDLARDNLASTSGEWSASTVYQLPYIPSDVSITYNTTENKFQMTGLNTPAPLFAWSAADTYASGTTYASGVYVTYNERVYRSLLAGNVGNVPSTSSTYWAFVTDKLVQDFAAYNPYYKGQYVASGGVIYQAANNIWTGSFSTLDGWEVPTQPLGPFYYRYLITGYNDPNVVLNQKTSSPAPRRQWNPYTLFESGDLVQYEGTTYQSTKQVKGFVPFSIPSTTTNLYSGTTSYVIGNYVYYSLKWYVCIKATVGNTPTGAYTNNTWWKFIEFSPNTTSVYWKVGDLMTYSGSVGNGVFWYKCIKDNNASQASPITTGGVFNTNPYWIPSYWTPSTSGLLPITGLGYISSQFDMIDFFGGYFQYPFVYGVPGQPFNPVPRRLLNSILGFSWNGLFDVNAVNAVLTSTNIVYSQTTVDVLNRIRPVPYYYKRTGVGVGSGQPTSAIIYTADGYGNLVYTSVVSIYSTIVFGSTLDTQRNTSLIGLSSMNAGNLGVSFFDNKIDGRLRVNGGDIYTIGIDLRDEMGEPYPVTNNGICTFTLKLTYKDTSAKIKDINR